MKTVKEVAKYLRVDPRFVTRLIREGKLKATKKGNMWFIESGDLYDYIEGVVIII